MVVRHFSWVLLAGLALQACAHATLDEARAAYVSGDLLRSADMLHGMRPESDADKRAVAELSRTVDTELRQVINSLLADAGRARGRGDEGLQGYGEAISYFEAALDLMTNDSEIKSTRASLQRAQGFHEKRVQTYLAARKKLEAMVKCGGATQRELVYQVWGYRRACDSEESLVPVVRRLAEICAKAERYEDALRLRAVLDDSSRDEAARRGVILDRWPTDAQRWFALVEVRAGDHALSTATTTTAPTATFSPITAAQASIGKEEPVRHRAPKKAEPAKVAPTPQVAAPAAPSRADTVLARARKFYEDGAVFDALLAIDSAMSEDLPDADRGKLEAQENSWSADRKRLIDEYQRKGETALREEQIEIAYSWYQRILTLDPSHEVAQDRVRRLDRLKSLRED